MINEGTANPDYEQRVQAVYESVLQSGDHAIDVGAHVGRHTIPIAQAVAPTGKVIAIEPLPACRKGLAKCIATHYPQLQEVVTRMPYALSDYEGNARFVVAKDALWFSGLEERVYDVPTRTRRIKVSVKTLDALFLTLPALRYIKIDAEGGEFHIVKGGARCIEKFRPLVTFEFGANSIAEYKITPEHMALFWRDAGYDVYDINGSFLSSVDEFVQSATLQHVWDYVAVPAEETTLKSTVLSALNAQSP